VEEIPTPDATEELLRQQVRNLRAAWDAAGIDLRGITNVMKADIPSSQLGGYIVSPGSRKRCDEAVQKFGTEDTLEALVLQPRFRDLFPEHVLRNARLRVERRPEPQ
jgi:hypothetical protein